MKLKKALAAAALPAVALAFCAPARAVVLIITIDENGNGFAQIVGDGGTSLSSSMRADPGPGGLASVLTYSLPGTVTAGDVFLQDLVSGTLQTLDVIRFNPAPPAGGAASVAFYSDNLDGADAIGDTATPPSLFYTNTVTLPEVGLEGIGDGAIYTPTTGQPGFISGSNITGVTYRFISDGAVPEPAIWMTMLLGFGLIGGAMRRRGQHPKVRFAF